MRNSPLSRSPALRPPRDEGAGCLTCRWWWDDTRNKFPPVRTFFLLGTCFFYFIDVALDGWVAYEHYYAGETGTDANGYYYFRATMFFIVAPLVAINFLSWALYAWGYVVYCSPRVRDYCNVNSEEMAYYDKSRLESGSRGQIRVRSIKVFSWPLCKLCNRCFGRREGSTEELIQSSAPMENVPPLQLVPPLNRPSSLPESRLASDTDTSSETSFIDGTATNGDTRQTSFIDQTVPNGDTMHYQTVHTKDNQQPDDQTSSPVLRLEVPEVEEPDLVATSQVDKDEPDLYVEFYPLDLFDASEFICVTLIHIVMLGFLFRVGRLMYKRKQDAYSFDRYRDISFLRLMEAFLESAPQLVLQLYAIALRDDARLWYKVITPISIAVSMVSLALAVADYISAAKDLYFYDPPPNHQRQPRLSWVAYFTIIFWHLCMIFARSVAFALFAVAYGSFLFVIIGLHYAAMVYWLYWQGAKLFVHSYDDYFDAHKHACGNYGVEFIVAAFNTFFHFKLKDGPGYVTLVPFYLVTFVENSLMILLWYFGRDFSVQIWFGTPALVGVFAAFFLGLASLLSYYVCCQPGLVRALEPDPNVEHPTLSSMSRIYHHKKMRGNFFHRHWREMTHGRICRRASIH